MNKTILILALLLFGKVSIAYGNYVSSGLNNFSDTSNIISYHNKLCLYLYSIRKFRTYELKNIQSGLKMKFEPNGMNNIGLGFNYKWMGIGLATSFPFMNKDNNIYGKTDRFDLQLNLFSRLLGFSAYYQKYKGFYLSNPKDLVNWENHFYPTISDMGCTSAGIYAFYFFNNQNFSYKAAYVRNEVQKKSAGGFVIGASADFDVVYAPSGFVPKELPDSLKKNFDFSGYSTYVFGLSFGYAYTLKFLKRIYVNLSLVPGIGFRNLSIWYITANNKTKPSFTGDVRGKFSIGYEGKNLYIGASSIAGWESFKYEEVDISSTSGQIKFYIGKRF